MTHLDDRSIIKAGDERPALVELRGRSGRLYGMLDRERLTIEIKRNEKIDTIDLKALLERPAP